MSTAFLTLLREFTGELTHISTHFPKAVPIGNESLDEAITDSLCSILVDETPAT